MNKSHKARLLLTTKCIRIHYHDLCYRLINIFAFFQRENTLHRNVRYAEKYGSTAGFR